MDGIAARRISSDGNSLPYIAYLTYLNKKKLDGAKSGQ
jgi:hypothetical protein